MNGINQVFAETALQRNSCGKGRLAHFKKGLGRLLQAAEMKRKIEHGRNPPKNAILADVLRCSNDDAAR